jgi:hypothetical protein
MPDIGTVNGINALLQFVLAGLLFVFWSSTGRKQTLYWMLAAWFFAISSVAYFLRPWIPFHPSTLLAALTITAGLICILMGVRRFMGMKNPMVFGLSILLFHGAMQSHVVRLGAPAEGRMLVNSLFWAALSAAILACFRRAAPGKWREWYGFPALVVGINAVFHSARAVVAALQVTGTPLVPTEWLQAISFASMGIFAMAIFMSLLIADLRVQNRELQAALSEVQELSGLLPICAGCKKIREDGGYWTHLETFIGSRSKAQFSHSLCPDCAINLYPDVFNEENVKVPYCERHSPQPSPTETPQEKSQA